MPPELQIGRRTWGWLSVADIRHLEEHPAPEFGCDELQVSRWPSLSVSDVRQLEERRWVGDSPPSIQEGDHES